MTHKRKLQIMLDLVMTALLPLLMAYSLIGECFHEWAGTAMFVLFLLHHALNWHWHKNLLRGRYTPFRTLGTAVNATIFLLMLAVMVSGIVMSRYTFSFLPFSGGAAIARKIHLAASYWCYVLTAVHMGLHGNMILGMAKRKISLRVSPATRNIAAKIITALLVVRGAYAFYRKGFPDYMLLQNEFVFFDFSEPLILFLTDYLAIMALFAVLGYYAAKALIRRRS